MTSVNADSNQLSTLDGIHLFPFLIEVHTMSQTDCEIITFSVVHCWQQVGENGRFELSKTLGTS